MFVARVLFVVLLSFQSLAQVVIDSDSSLVSYLRSKDPLIDKVLGDSSYRVQLVYTSLRKTEDEVRPITFAHTSDQYFYPASTVKLPIALLTLEKLERLGLGLDDVLKINDDVDCGNKKFITLTQSRDITFRTLIEEMIVVSDNYYYNCLYHFVTPKEINDRLKELGFGATNIYRSFSGCDVVNHLHTNSLEVRNANGAVVYEQEEQYMNLCDMSGCYVLSEDKKLGEKHEYKRQILDGPYDFNYNLELSLEDLSGILLKLVQPSLFLSDSVWRLNDLNRNFIVQTCARYPSDLANLQYRNNSKYPDNIYKYVYSSEGEIEKADEGVISKLGLSYGFTTDVAFVIDRKSDVQYLLAVSIYTNKNKIVNDGVYEYEEIARPFISAVAKELRAYESTLKNRAPLDTDLLDLIFE